MLLLSRSLHGHMGDDICLYSQTAGRLWQVEADLVQGSITLEMCYRAADGGIFHETTIGFVTL